MTDTPISPLRRRMIEDMTVRKFAARTQEGYIRAVKGFSAFLGASPDTASAEDLRRYHLHLVSRSRTSSAAMARRGAAPMPAIERCRTAALGGHVARCERCAHTQIAYNSCRNRHCPKCQASAARQWLAAREAELLPVGYFHVVYTVPAPIADIAYQNKRAIYDLLMKAAAETTLTIAADRRHLGARIGITAVLHTWGSALTHHPH